MTLLIPFSNRAASSPPPTNSHARSPYHCSQLSSGTKINWIIFNNISSHAILPRALSFSVSLLAALSFWTKAFLSCLNLSQNVFERHFKSSREHVWVCMEMDVSFSLYIRTCPSGAAISHEAGSSIRLLGGDVIVFQSPCSHSQLLQPLLPLLLHAVWGGKWTKSLFCCFLWSAPPPPPTHTHTHTHTHTQTCWFLWFTGTLHRRNGFYTEQTVCAIALHLPYT